MDVLVIGAGLVGLATARALVHRGLKVRVLEAEPEIAFHQSSHNSGVIHSGLYYKPGSAKARTCVLGRDALYHYCRERAIPHRRTGKLVLATDEAEAGRLRALKARGEENGLSGLELLPPDRIREREPAAAAGAGGLGLFVPATGVVDYPAVARALGEDITRADGEILTNEPVRAIHARADRVSVETERATHAAGHLVACAGLASDRIARMAGLRPRARILPFRGEYLVLRPERTGLVRGPIYPVPDPRFPFLGVHLTPTIDGRVEAGPNAVLATARRGYRWRDLDPRDLAEMLAFPGLWRLAGRYPKTAVGEVLRSWSRARFAASLQRLVPEIQAADLLPGGSGVRAQAVLPDGTLVDDFWFEVAPRMLHVLNAPSPAATACLRIGEEIAERLWRQDPAPPSPRLLSPGLRDARGRAR